VRLGFLVLDLIPEFQWLVPFSDFPALKVGGLGFGQCFRGFSDGPILETSWPWWRT
jgi:hypothetical protein